MDAQRQQVVVTALLSAAVAGVLGFVLGNQYGRAGGRALRDDAVVAAPVTAAPPAGMGGGGGGAAPAAAGPTLEQSQQIATAEAIAAKTPGDAKVWIALGNLYFDTHQPQKAVEAYGRALALKPDDPDVLTDQGVMYRDLGQFDSALANFQKANRIAPDHLQSLYNIGVVQGFDKHDVAGAEKTWARLIQLAPQSEQAAQARQALDHLKQH